MRNTTRTATRLIAYGSIANIKESEAIVMARKDTVIGSKYDVMLWGFKCTLRDRRSGEHTDGYIVVTGNEEYNLEEAKKEIRDKYGRIGYTVTECEYDDTRIFTFDALEIYKHSRCSRCAGCDYYIKEDDSVGQPRGCEVLIDMEEEENKGTQQEYEALSSAFDNNGYNCQCYKIKEGSKKPVEDKPDYLAEIMATLAELDDTESEVKEN